MRILMAAVLLLAAAARASAQDAERIERFERTLDEVREKYFETTAGLTLTERTRFLYGAYTTFGGLVVDDEGGASRVLRQLDSKLWMQVQSAGHLFYGRVRFRYRDFDEGDAFTGEDSSLVDPLGDRYWYRFDWRADQRAEEGVDPGWTWWVQVGRQMVHWM